MPYGGKIEFEDRQNCNFTDDNGRSNSVLCLPYSTYIAWSRSGSNRNSQHYKTGATAQYTFIPFWATVKLKGVKRYKGESFAEYDARRTTRVIRYRKQRLPKRKASKTFSKSLVSNDLDYQRLVISCENGGAGATFLYDPQYTRSCSGPLALNQGSGGLFGWGGETRPPAPLEYLDWNWAFLEDPSFHEQHLYALHERVRNKNVDIQTFLATISQTRNTLVECFGRIGKILLAAKKLRFKTVLKEFFGGSSPKAVSDSYLLWQYGLKPLASDIDGMIKQLAEEFSSFTIDDVIVPKKLVAKRTIPWSCGKPFAATGELEQSVIIEHKYKVRIKLTSDILKTVDQLGFNSPLVTAWEIVPWSFAIDWFLPIGRWLNTQTDLIGLELVEVTRTEYVKMSSKFTLSIGGMDSSLFVWSGNGGSWSSVITSCKRTSLPNALPAIPFPKFQSNPRLDISLALFVSKLSK
jgi:hypothetical protein